MNVQRVIEDITLVAEAGDAEDALDLSRQYIRAGATKLAINIRRTVTKGVLDRDALRKLAVTVAEDNQRAQEAARRTFRALAREARTLNLPDHIVATAEQIARIA